MAKQSWATVDGTLQAKCAAQALGTCRPTAADAEILRSALRSFDSADPADAQGDRRKDGRKASTTGTSQFGHWVPLVEGVLGPACWRGLLKGPAKLRPLTAHTPLDVHRLAATLHSVQAGDSGGVGELDEAVAVQKWEPLGELAASKVPAPVHEVFSRLGAVDAAARARTEVQQTLAEAARNGSLTSLDSNEKSRPIAMQDLAAFEWAGMECHGVDEQARTPLHLLCAVEGQKLIGDAVHNAAPATLARWFCARWPAALLVEDAEGLTPLNYLTPPLCANFGYNGGSHRELLIAVAESFEHCIHQCPVDLVTTLRCSESLRTAVLGAARLGAEARHSSEVLPSLMQLAEGGAWECALIAWRNDTIELRERCQEAADIQARIRTSRILAGVDSAIPDQAVLFQKFLVDINCFAASIGCEISDEPVVKYLLEQVEDAQSKWHERQHLLEERMADLEAELGRLPAAAARSTEAAAPAAGLAGPLMTPASAGEPAGVEEVVALSEKVPQSFAQQEAEEFVNCVRRLRLVDANLDDTSALVRDGADRVRQVLVRAVERIAEDLYELESHFIYELVQNADDNRYPDTFDSGGPQCPTLRLLLRFDEGDDTVGRGPGTFFFSANNELGLRGEDVMALCDVNASSKKGKKGYTGQKGIGWKSTFQVSDCPYMLSGAFSFKFDIAGPLGRLGYVTPTWVGAKELAALPREVLEAHAAGATVVYLPLRPGAAASVSHALEHLEEHHPCLLFMRRLRRLKMEYSDGRSTAYERTGEGSDGKVLVTKCLAGQEVSRETLNYLVYSHDVELPSGDHSHLSLAFPMTLDIPSVEERGSAAGPATDGGPGSLEPPLQALYCGPPVRRVGFRFAINGPFDLVANRGDIHEGSAANRVLCEAIPVAFAAALRLHKQVIGPRTLAFIGQESVDGLWRRIRTRVLACLQGAACVRTEDGGLATPEECVLRPSGALAAAASWLIPAELLLKACRLRFAKGGQSHGALRGLGLEVLGLEHWEQILAYRGDEWPNGLVGAAATHCDGAGFFRPLLAWLEEEVRLAEHPGDTLQRLWAMELWPSAEPAAKLMALGEGPILNSFCKDLPEDWQRTLCDAGALRVLDPRVRSELEGGAARFAAAVTAAEPSSSLVAGLCLEWHLLRFTDSHLRPANEEAIWASLACMMEAFHAGCEPHAFDTAGAVSPVAATEIGKTLSNWSEVGSVLFWPAHGGMPPLARCPALVCPTYLGVPGLSPQMVSTAVHTSIMPSSAALGSTGLAPPHRFLSPRYLDGTWGDLLRWEVFLDKVGMIPLSLRPAGGVPKCVRANIAETLGNHLADEAWWSKALATPTLSKYVCDRIQGACEEELICLRGLPVTSNCSVAGGNPPLACVSGIFLYGSYGPLGSKHLPYARLPASDDIEKVADLENARKCLTMLGVTTVVTVQGLVQSLEVLKIGGVRDVELFADLYKHIAQADMAADQGISREERQALSRLVFVPKRGFVDAAACTWEDTGLMQWLAEAPTLETFYGRYGPSLRHFFVNIAGVSTEVGSFHPKLWVHALKRIVGLVDDACQPSAQLPGAPISAQALLHEIGSLAGEVYRHMAAACCSLSDRAAKAATAALETERLLLLAATAEQPKRVYASETWWDVAPELSQEEPLTKLSLRNHYGHLPGVERFFVKIVGIRPELTRKMLKDQLNREYITASELTHWGSLSPADLMDLAMLQTSSVFRRACGISEVEDGDDDEEFNQDARTDQGSRARSGEQPAASQDPSDGGNFRPRKARNPHVPAWRRRPSDSEQGTEEQSTSNSRREEQEPRSQNDSSPGPKPAAKKPKRKFVVLDKDKKPGEASVSPERDRQQSATASQALRSSLSPPTEVQRAANRGPNAPDLVEAVPDGPKALPGPPPPPPPPLTAEEAQKILSAADAARADGFDPDQDENLLAAIPAEHIQIISQRIELYEKQEELMREESERLREEWIRMEDEIERYSKILDRFDSESATSIEQQAKQSGRPRGFTSVLEQHCEEEPSSGSGQAQPRFMKYQRHAAAAAAPSAAPAAVPAAVPTAVPAERAAASTAPLAAASSETPAASSEQPAPAASRRRGFTSALGEKGASAAVKTAPAASESPSAASAGAAAPGRRRGFSAALAGATQEARPSNTGSASACASSVHQFAHGDWVLVHGLQGRADLNNQMGRLDGYSEAKGRYVVCLGDERVFLKPENLQKASGE